ncbi:hypothetical protein [Leifsonia poae]|uniref:hypothetical protein n=1 Tax=Leifsonia poae TaxID=110933 RepID=UPI001CBC61E9|nr:hypothetical protein [Leifsonia poae]
MHVFLRRKGVLAPEERIAGLHHGIDGEHRGEFAPDLDRVRHGKRCDIDDPCRVDAELVAGNAPPSRCAVRRNDGDMHRRVCGDSRRQWQTVNSCCRRVTEEVIGAHHRLQGGTSIEESAVAGRKSGSMERAVEVGAAESGVWNPCIQRLRGCEGTRSELGWKGAGVRHPHTLPRIR